jgi:hypothetical protein
MRRLQKASILTELMVQLRASGSWCGETHVQKATYFLQEVLGVETGFEYILYKHGPYSFDLAEELTSLCADFLLEYDHRSPGYGPSLVPTEASAALRARFPKTMARHVQPIRFIASKFGSKGVTELEKLATALWVTRELGDDAGSHQRAERIHALKPHVNMADAHRAVAEFDQITLEAKAVALGDGHE